MTLRYLLAVVGLFSLWKEVPAFAPPPKIMPTGSTSTHLSAKPERLEENARGVVYVNDRCINCAACSNFAPETFSRSPADTAHVVHQQPSSEEQVRNARAALSACPVAAIRLETLGERRHQARSPEEKKLVEDSWTPNDELLLERMVGIKHNASKPFPRQFLDDESLGEIYWLGHHNEKSFGATPYLFRTSYNGNDNFWIMVDTPKYGPSAIKAVESLTGPRGPDILFLTHVDDTADHGKWAEHYTTQAGSPSLKRIFHAGDLGRHNWVGDLTLEDVEILLQSNNPDSDDGLRAFNLQGEPLPNDWQDSCNDEVIIVSTPGHSPGSITLYRRPNDTKVKPGILFTGDTYGYTTRGGGKMTSFHMYGNNLRQQSETLQKLVELDWSVIAPGHAHPHVYNGGDKDEQRVKDLQVALEDMAVSRRW
mmetsp:Transcript_405/g.1115  ORF Transcript_405/g.1115 Transcript_405/m.1115 type:complete len:423 (-) Transcript_405:1073-2341(-)